ncbi:MAG: MFS transporter [Bryobacteraceae bacterium]
MDAQPVSLPAYWRLIRSNRNFRLLWGAQMVSEIGDWLYAVSIYSLLLELTGSAQSVAAAVVLQLLPQFFFAPIAGVVNDRISRRTVMIAADLVRAAVVACMILVQTREMVPLLYVLLFCETVMWAFFEPGRTATIPNVTRDKGETVVANALSSLTWSFNLAFGATVGGVVAVLFGRNTVFVINAGSFLVSALFLRRLKIDEPHTVGSKPLRMADLADFSPIREGLAYVLSNRRLFATLLVKAGLGLLGAHWVILPIFGERIFPLSVEQLGAGRAGMLGMSLLLGSRGIGAMLGPIAGGYWAGRSEARLRLGIVAGFCCVALGYTALSAAGSIWTACASVVLAHAGGSMIWVFSTTLLHYQTEDRFRGRVFSADFSFMVLTMSIITFLAGTAVDLGISVRTISLLTGVIALVPATLWILALRLWREDR